MENKNSARDSEGISRQKDFRRMLGRISKQLLLDDVDFMKLSCVGLPGQPGHAEIENVKTGFDFFMLLLKYDTISHEHCEDLVEMLTDAGRLDLAKEVKEFVDLGNSQSHTSSPGQSPANISEKNPITQKVGLQVAAAQPSLTNPLPTSNPTSGTQSQTCQEDLSVRPKAPSISAARGKTSSASGTTHLTVESSDGGMGNANSSSHLSTLPVPTKNELGEENRQPSTHQDTKPKISTLNRTHQPRGPSAGQSSLQVEGNINESFGYLTLSSNEVSGSSIAAKRCKPGPLSLTESDPNPSDIGPTIQPPSSASDQFIAENSSHNSAELRKADEGKESNVSKGHSGKTHLSVLGLNPNANICLSKELERGISHNISQDENTQASGDLDIGDGVTPSTNDIETDAPHDSSYSSYASSAEQDNALRQNPHMKKVTEILPVGDLFQTKNEHPEVVEAVEKNDNFIICSPAGNRKKLAAICVSICQRVYDNAQHDTPFKAIVIVNMQHMMHELASVIKEVFSDGSVAIVDENSNILTEFSNPNHKVIIVTAQTLVNALESHAILLSDISLLVFYECHHMKQEHSSMKVMAVYLEKKKTQPDGIVGKSGQYLPQIVGLSPSLGTGQEKDAYQRVLTLCAQMDGANVIQVNRIDVNKLVSSPEGDEICYTPRRSTSNRAFGHTIEGLMFKIQTRFWKSTGHVPTEYGSHDYEQWIKREEKQANKSKSAFAGQRLSACRHLLEYNLVLGLYEDLRATDVLCHLEIFIQNQNRQQKMPPGEEFCLNVFKEDHSEIKRACNEEKDEYNPKLKKLADILRQQYELKPDSKGIILVGTRIASTSLMDFVKSTELLRGLQHLINPVQLVGKSQQKRLGQQKKSSGAMSQFEQKQALATFREENACNLLIATDIVQEDLHLPPCQFLIRYNFVSNEIGTVQFKEHAKDEPSRCFLIIEKDSKSAERETENRAQVVNMQAAMDELNSLSETDRRQQIKAKQEDIYNSMEAKAKLKGESEQTYDPEDVKIVCAQCEAYMTQGSSMRRSGSHFICKDPRVHEHVRVVPYKKPMRKDNWDTQNTGDIKCSKCKHQMGIAVDYLRGDVVIKSKQVAFSKDGVRSKLPGVHKPKRIKQWSKVPFIIPKDED